MPLNACIVDECTFAAAPGSVFCPGHHAEHMARTAGVSEPEVEARVQQVRTEDDSHPGMRKVYDPETGEPSWVPMEQTPPGVAEALKVYTVSPPAIPREINADHSPAWLYVAACLDGDHGAMRKAVAEALLRGVEQALKGL